MVDVEKDHDIEFEEPSSTETKKKKDDKDLTRKGAEAHSKIKKIRLTIDEVDEGPLNTLTNTLKDRGVKNPDVNQLVMDALATIPESWWTQKLEELTPLEWKVQAALDNPDLREKLVTLLEGKR